MEGEASAYDQIDVTGFIRSRALCLRLADYSVSPNRAPVSPGGDCVLTIANFLFKTMDKQSVFIAPRLEHYKKIMLESLAIADGLPYDFPVSGQS
jgi:hypothetical protein